MLYRDSISTRPGFQVVVLDPVSGELCESHFAPSRGRLCQ